MIIRNWQNALQKQMPLAFAFSNRRNKSSFDVRFLAAKSILLITINSLFMIVFSPSRLFHFRPVVPIHLLHITPSKQRGQGRNSIVMPHHGGDGHLSRGSDPSYPQPPQPLDKLRLALIPHGHRGILQVRSDRPQGGQYLKDVFHPADPDETIQWGGSEGSRILFISDGPIRSVGRG